MSYKSILTYTDSDGEPENHVSVAMDLARRFDGHLTITALGCDPDVPPSAFGDFPGIEMAEVFEQSRERADAMARKAAELMERESVKGDGRALVSTYSALPRAFGRLARFSDLVVLGQPSGPTEPHEAMNLIEGTLFDGDAAALICPEKVERNLPESIVIGWNGDREALQAVRRAMPFLREAKSVEIAIIEPTEMQGEPGAELALFLARHGIGVEIATSPQEGHSVSEVLRQRVADRHADLLVMGAYGHSRFREYVLGGVTRDVLRKAAVPVLMAH
jgi:nucleotide-binding universal stress UspA family protein